MFPSIKVCNFDDKPTTFLLLHVFMFSYYVLHLGFETARQVATLEKRRELTIAPRVSLYLYLYTSQREILKITSVFLMIL